MNYLGKNVSQRLANQTQQSAEDSREWRITRLTVSNITDLLTTSGAESIECRFRMESEASKAIADRNEIYFRTFWNEGELMLKLTAVYGNAYQHLALDEGEECCYALADMEAAIQGEVMDLTVNHPLVRMHFLGLVSALLEIYDEEERMLAHIAQQEQARLVAALEANQQKAPRIAKDTSRPRASVHWLKKAS